MLRDAAGVKGRRQSKWVVERLTAIQEVRNGRAGTMVDAAHAHTEVRPIIRSHLGTTTRDARTYRIARMGSHVNDSENALLRIEALLTRARAHTHRQVRHADVQSHGQGGTGIMARINRRVALWITLGVGTMYCAYAFAALAFVSLPAAIRSGDPVVLVSWISQTFLQLVLLSVIMVGQNVIAAASDARAEADHETLQLLHQLNVTQLEILQELRQRRPDAGERE